MSLDDLLRRQGGVITPHQAVAHGMSRQTVQRRARDGEWSRLHPHVYLVGGHRLTDEARVRAAWLWSGESGVVSGPAAARWHGLLDRAPREIELTVPGRCKPRGRTGIQVLGHPFGPWRVDLAFPREKVAVEVDGWAWHVDAARFRNDRRKQNALVRAGWDPLRFTWHDLDGQPGGIVAEVQATLDAAA